MLESFKRFIGRYRKPIYHETCEDGHKVVFCVSREGVKPAELFFLFTSRLSDLWPELFSKLKTDFAEYGHAEKFPPEPFFFHISRMTPDVYMGDQSSFHLRLEIETEKFSDEISIYDFFLDDDFRIVHSQPVF